MVDTFAPGDVVTGPSTHGNATIIERIYVSPKGGLISSQDEAYTFRRLDGTTNWDFKGYLQLANPAHKFKPGDRVFDIFNNDLWTIKEDIKDYPDTAYTVLSAAGEDKGTIFYERSLVLVTHTKTDSDPDREDVLFAISASMMPQDIQEYLTRVIGGRS